jgi:hypothetical protein
VSFGIVNRGGARSIRHGAHKIRGATLNSHRPKPGVQVRRMDCSSRTLVAHGDQEF